MNTIPCAFVSYSIYTISNYFKVVIKVHNFFTDENYNIIKFSNKNKGGTNMAETKYKDGLDSIEIKLTGKFAVPWLENFLCRFYEQLKKQNATKREITRRVTKIAQKPSLLPINYILHPNTLTQCTNFNSTTMREISVTNLIAVSLALGVSINYLLGIDKCESPENTDINKVTGLTNEAIEAIKSNEKLQEKLDFFLLSSKLDSICEEIDQLFMTRLVFNDILNGYKEELYKKIENVYKKFFSETFALERTEERYKEYLYQELSFEKIKSDNAPNNIMDYLKSNLEQELITQIELQLENYNNYDEQDIYHVFIDLTANFTYDIFEKQYTDEIQMNRISQSVTTLINDYIQSKIQTAHENMRNNTRKIS